MIALTHEALRLKEALLEEYEQTVQEWAACSDANQPEALLLRDKRRRLIDANLRAEKRLQRRLEKIE